MKQHINIISASSRDSKVLHIGIVLQCNEHDTFGIVVGYSCSEIRGSTMMKMGFPILSYFEKERGFQLKEKTFVVYLVNSNDYEHALEIKELSSFKLINGSLDNEIQTFSPFIQMEKGFKCLYYPTKKQEAIIYLEKVLTAEENALLEYFLALKEFEVDNIPSQKEREDKLLKIHTYVQNFEIEKELQTYSVTQSAWFQSRPGRDDHYFMEEKRSIESTDPYIRSLLPLCNDLNYYSCNGRSSDEVDFSRKNDQQIKADKTKAIKMYSKTNHINFLINDYYEHIFSNKDKKNKIWADIESILDYYHIEECCGKYFYNTLTIKHYNNLRQNITTK